ncbi:MAG: serine hydrolase, partial [Actinomycetota bacterium]
MRELTGIEPARLERVIERQYMLHGGDSWSLAIVRRGYLVREAHTFNVLAPTRFDIWSCTKSFTSTSFGLLIDDSRSGRLPGGGFDLDSPVYKRIPEGHP